VDLGCKFTYWDRNGTGVMKLFNNEQANKEYIEIQKITKY